MRTSTAVARRALDAAGICVFVVACPLPQAHALVVSYPGGGECVAGTVSVGVSATPAPSPTPAPTHGHGPGSGRGPAMPPASVALAGTGIPIQIGPASPGAVAPESQISTDGGGGRALPRADRDRTAAVAHSHRQTIQLLTVLLIVALVPVVLQVALRRRGRR